MIIGINTACLQKKSSMKPLEILETSLDNGFKAIEFRDEFPFSEDLNAETKKLIRNRIEREKLLCSVHLSFYDLNIGSFRKKIRNEAVESHRNAVINAAELGAAYVTIHGGKMSRSFYKEELLADVDKYSSESISLISETCHDAGITLSVENMSLFKSKEYKSFTGPEHLKKLYYDQNEEIKITFDFGHAVTINRNPEVFVEQLGAEKISFGHLSDNNFLTDQHLGLGEGQIDYNSFMETYTEKKWNFPLLIETSTMKQALDSKRYLEDIISTIKK